MTVDGRSERTYDLSWSQGFSFQEILKNVPQMQAYQYSGVYLWVDYRREKGRRDISYVGKSASDMVRRQFQHYQSCIAGNSIIHKEYRCDGLEWIPNQRKDIYLDEMLLLDFVRDAYAFLNTVRIYFCPLACEQSVIQDIERKLIYDLQPLTNNRGKAYSALNETLIVRHFADHDLKSLLR